MQIGKDLKVRYVIYLEINALSLYMPKSNNQFYQGETDIKVTLVNVQQAGRPARGGRLPRDVPDHADQRVRRAEPARRSGHKFLDHVAEKIAWDFTSHPTEKDYAAE